MSRSQTFDRARATLLGAACALLLIPGSLLGQEGNEYPTFRWDGQFRLRAEADGRTSGVDPDFATLSRVRLGAGVGLLDWLDVYAQIQDARAWGSELNTLTDASADHLDMHQIYADMGSTPAFKARLGRQIAFLADQRLIGAVEWSNTGRSFDGVRFLGKASGLSWTAFVMNVRERDSLLAVGLHPQDNQGVFDDGWLVAVFGSRKFGDVNSEFTFAYDRKAATDESYTVNLRLHGRTGAVLYEGAGAYQFGPDRSAFFGSGKAGVAIGKATIAAQLDYLSGDTDPTSTTTNAFNTLYATNHKFYGYMDYFLFIPQQLDRAGLVDGILRGSLATSANTTVRLDVHRFLTAKERLGTRQLGTEIDLVGRWNIAAPATLDAGFAVFAPDDLASVMLPAFAGNDSMTWWGYVQLFLKWP
jgi:hypothetical protein